MQVTRYEIHAQPEMPSVDMEFHLAQWLEFLRIFVYGGNFREMIMSFPV